MGNNQPLSVNEGTAKKTKFQDFELVKKISDGKLIMRHNQTSQLCVVIQHTFPCEELLNQYIKQHKNNLNISHQFYLSAYDHQILSLTNICSKQYKIIEYFDYQCHTLKEEIESRSINDRYFSTKQTLSILCSCVLAMSHFCKQQIVHYTLSPSDIVINDEGICKILNLSLSEFIFDFNIKQTFYYAPETLKIFKMQSISNGLTNKSAVFTLGITILNMIYLTPMNHLYNFNNLTINMVEMNQLLHKIQDSDLQMILTKMLKYHSYERITFTELEEMLFDIISKSQNQQNRDDFLYNQKTQANKLQQSIVKIAHPNYRQQEHQNHQSLFQYPKSKLNVHIAQCMANDDEDLSQLYQTHLLITQIDAIMVDQNDKNNNLQYYSGRDSIVQTQIQSNFNKLSNYSATNNRILTENLNFSNLTDTKKYKVQNKSIKNITQTQKILRNSTEKNLQIIYPQYVNEIVKEGRYQGYKMGKYRHGFGTFYYNQGGKYCGEWVKNRMEGRGVLYYSTNKIAYQGEWLQDMLHGYGVIYNENVNIIDSQLDFTHLQLISNEWIKYEGYFKNDVKYGQGSIYFSNGQTFRGMFQNDHPNGMGQFRNIRGEVFKGFWLMGALNSIS